LLPDATRDQRIATAFNRLHRQTNEGGSVEEEFRVDYVADRTDTLGAAFLGLTLGCARCHDHKYDPISQKEYYQLFAFFDNIDECGLYSHFTDAMPTPTLLLTTDQQQSEIQAAEAAIRQAEQRLEQLAAERRDAFDAWLQQRPEGPMLADRRFPLGINRRGTIGQPGGRVQTGQSGGRSAGGSGTHRQRTAVERREQYDDGGGGRFLSG
jgi:hypothetical protein